MSGSENKQVQQLVDHLFRHEAGKLVSVISRIFGIAHLDLAEDLVQDTLMEALHRWSVHDIPDNPTAWLMQVAKRKTLNELKRRQTALKNQPHIAQQQISAESIDEAFLETKIEDSQLRMVFVCCHPELPLESQIALTLKSLCGFSVKEVASALLTTTANINKRLYRAKVRFRDLQINLEIPPTHLLPPRVDAVCLSLYLLFNEGYQSSHAQDLIRKDLCMEAIRLATLLANAFPDQTKVAALLALMFLHTARFDARQDVEGAIIILEDQDRSRWDQRLIATGMHYLKKASTGEVLSEYHLEAGIAADHCLAPSMEATDWKSISSQYDLLNRVNPSPIIAFNQAIILRWTEGPQQALLKLEELQTTGKLKKYHLLLAGIGEMQFLMGQNQKARACFLKAKTLTDSIPQQELLDRKILACEIASN